ncbi:putative acetyltransferase [Arthrobacter cavernae]|uniref:Histone acetyltransferase Rv0428c-like SH3 domain-containing protein n=1 Tax=Arthrobacter cavernae TaxID=2817681 RepID=A0A939KN76_9MICC|nr:hypothetical protein [Arthrobacter cavernae]MBO1267345.1 hypothetical protein [Arthrobacter cavernae]
MNQPFPHPQDFLLRAPAGIRVVVRYRIDGGMTDALGQLVAVGGDSCTVRTRTSDVEIPLDRVVAAKEVPPAPVRRQAARD